MVGEGLEPRFVSDTSENRFCLMLLRHVDSLTNKLAVREFIDSVENRDVVAREEETRRANGRK